MTVFFYRGPFFNRYSGLINPRCEENFQLKLVEPSRSTIYVNFMDPGIRAAPAADGPQAGVVCADCVVEHGRLLSGTLADLGPPAY